MAPRVFISYSHESAERKKWVAELAQRLRRDGVDAWIDQFELDPAQGWPQWVVAQLEAADFVVCVCTPTYRRRFEGNEAKGLGRGTSWEGFIGTQLLYHDTPQNRKFIPVYLEFPWDESIPLVLHSYTRYELPGEYEQLVRRLHEIPEVTPAPLGEGPRAAGQPARDDRSSADLRPADIVSSGLPPAVVEALDEEEPQWPGEPDEDWTQMDLVSPLDGTVHFHAALATRYGAESKVWTPRLYPDRPLIHPSRRVMPLQPFAVLIEAKTKDPSSLVAQTHLKIVDTVDEGSWVKPGELIAHILVRESAVQGPWSVSRGEAFGGVLKYRPRLNDRAWRERTTSGEQGRFRDVYSVGDKESGTTVVRAPVAGVFLLAEDWPAAHTRVAGDRLIGHVKRGAEVHRVTVPTAALLVEALVGSSETVHAGQALVRLRTEPPIVHLHLQPHATSDPWWYELLSPLEGRFSLEPEADGIQLEAGTEIRQGQTLCRVDSGNVRLELSVDLDGTLMETLAEHGEAVRFGQPLLALKATLVRLRSPMVGTFYRSPAPGEPPFVEPGARVGRGQTLCILEALKLENELESEVDGIVETVEVDDGQPVEWSQTLFTFRSE